MLSVSATPGAVLLMYTVFALAASIAALLALFEVRTQLGSQIDAIRRNFVRLYLPRDHILLHIVLPSYYGLVGVAIFTYGQLNYYSTMFIFIPIVILYGFMCVYDDTLRRIRYYFDNFVTSQFRDLPHFYFHRPIRGLHWGLRFLTYAAFTHASQIVSLTPIMQTLTMYVTLLLHQNDFPLPDTIYLGVLTFFGNAVGFSAAAQIYLGASIILMVGPLISLACHMRGMVFTNYPLLAIMDSFQHYFWAHVVGTLYCLVRFYRAPMERYIDQELTFDPVYKLQSKRVLPNQEIKLESGSFEPLSDALGKFREFVSEQSDEAKATLGVITDVSLLMYQLSRSRSKQDQAAAIAVFCRSRWTDMSMEKEIFNHFQNLLISDFTLQSYSDYIDGGTKALDEFRSLRNSPGMAKIHRFTMYVLTLGLFKSAGLDLDRLGFTKVEQAAAEKKFKFDTNFVDSIMEMTLFIATAGYQAAQGFGVGHILHSGRAYSSMYEEYRIFVADFERYASFGLAAGVDHTRFMGRCEVLMDKIARIQPLVGQLSKPEQRFVGSMETRLLSIEAELKSTSIALATRPAPFSILLAGHSSVGKSSLVDILYSYFGKIHDLKTESKYKYVVSNVAKYWDNFSSEMWAVVLDDIGFRHPKLGQPDQSVDQILNIVNNIPMMPDQASLDNKGSTPLLARLIIATTNCEDLNVRAYYSNPAAVLRRFPYVVNVKVRPEFATEQGGLNPGAIPPDTVYPDFWELTVTEVRAISVKSVSRTEIGTFTSIAEFLKWYKSAMDKFDEQQAKAISSSNKVLEAETCKVCALPEPLCSCEIELQSGIGDFSFVLLRWILFIVLSQLMSLFMLVYYHPICGFLLRSIFNMTPFGRWCSRLNTQLCNRIMPPRLLMLCIGNRVRDSVIRVPRIFLILVTVLTTAVSVRMFCRAFEAKPQGLTHSVGSSAEPLKKERENIYYNDGSLKSDFEGSPISHSMSMSQFVSNVTSNVVVSIITDDQGIVTYGRLLGLCGNYYLTNNHSVPRNPTNGVFLLGEDRNGAAQRISCDLFESDVHRVPDRDLCIIRLNSLPPRKDITKYFGGAPTYGSTRAVYAGRSEDGRPQPISVGKVSYANVHLSQLGVRLPAAETASAGPFTQNGDCGMPLIADSGSLKAIVGIHVAARQGTFGGHYALANVVSRAEIDEMLKAMRGENECIISTAEPVLHGKSIQRPIGALHHKSVFRYLEDGSVTIYGSFQGFRPQHKSHVTKTMMNPHLKEIGISSTFGPPVMKGYRPWRIAAQALVNPVTGICAARLRACSDAYIGDVLKNVPHEAFQMLKKYDTFTALNGAEGVAFVDGINRSTSVGAPYGGPKSKHFTIMEPERGLQQPIKLKREMEERIDVIRERYKQGELYRPVFTAHLKDEPVSAKKQLSGKTRVFCGAPFDWTVVVREYFLSHIRLMQNFKFDFECAVGTVAQSIEWSRAFAHVTRFGKDRIIAGDYAAFDKTMPPVVILESFRVLIQLASISGNFTDGDYQVMWCIAYDTAYGMTDFNGDLVTFWGSNPSGHPLTVIINSIANSLYVRLVYSHLYDVKTFRSNVSLLTYGDDNIMSVRRGCDNFNHTFMMNQFAKYNIKYTMADKEAESIPFIGIEDASFLKRTWRYDHKQMVYLAPLEEASIHKMLCVTVRSKTISFHEQMSEIMRAAHAEWWFYGPEKFSWADTMLNTLIEKVDLKSWFHNRPLPSDDRYWERFWDSSQRVNFQL